MKRIDSHQHFWQYNPAEHTWMSEHMQGLKRNFLPADLAPLLSELNFQGCIAVQARQSMAETNWLLELAGAYDFIRGVVGWVDLRSANISEVLAGYSGARKLVGVRHVLHDEADDQFMMQPAFLNGIAALKEFGLAYDLLLFPRHIPIASQLVKRFPDQPFVLDHIGKPFIKRREFSPWIEDLKELTKHPNVFCKLSGMVTEATWYGWKEPDFKEYLDLVTEAFGTDRLMIGSDWPVCTVSGDYCTTMNIVINYARQFPADVCEDILGGNCIKFYKISMP